jgi:hypothetical protein
MTVILTIVPPLVVKLVSFLGRVLDVMEMTENSTSK